jgi:hypothetical protein
MMTRAVEVTGANEARRRPRDRTITALPSLKRVKPQQILDAVQRLRGEERQAIAHMIAYLAEVDRRELYKLLGYASFYAYLTEELGYSSGSANRRIAVSRIFQRHPTVFHKILTGSLTLSQLADSYSEVRARGQETLSRIEGLSRSQTRTARTLPNSPYGSIPPEAARLSDPIADRTITCRVPQLKVWLGRASADDNPGLRGMALAYIQALEVRVEALKNEVRRLRSA